MSKKNVVIQLERELKNGDIEMEKVVVKRMKTRQLNQTMKVVTAILEIIADSPDLQEMIFDMFKGGRDFNREIYKVEGLTDEEIEEERRKFIDQKNDQFVDAILSAFPLILGRLPDLTVELLSAVSKIDLDTLLDQEPVLLFDVFDAIVEVNDLKELINRGKQSSSTIQTVLGMIFTKEETPISSSEKADLVAIPQQ